MRAEDLAAVNAERRARRAVILLTDIDNAASRVIREGDGVDPDLREAVERAFRTGKSAIIEQDGRRSFINVHVPPARIVVIGAVHISQALAAMAAIAGFDLVVIDPRTAFATPERFSGVDLVADWPEDVLATRPLDAYTALVAVTHDPKIDDFPIEKALRAQCLYVGALGSRKTHAKRVERLAAAGILPEQIARISAPIGIDIGASSPEEIAVAVLADIIMALRKRDVIAPRAAE